MWFQTAMRSPFVFFAIVFMGLMLASPARADAECFPKCRSGFVCTPEQKCVSECNPPCGNAEVCKAGACVTESEATPVSTETKKLEMVWSGGVGAHVSTVTAPVILTSFSVAYGGNHALLGGIQGGVAFFDNFIGTATIGEVGLNLGYRGIFTKTDVGVGMFALVTPQVWTGGDALLGLGGTIGGILTYKRLVIQVPLNVERVATFKNHWSTSKKAVVFTPAVLAGISF